MMHARMISDTLHKSLPVTNEELLKPLKDLSPDDILFLDVNDDMKKFNIRISTRGAEEASAAAAEGRLYTGRMGFPSRAARLDFPMRFPEHRVVPGTFDCRYEISATDISAMLIRHVWPAGQLKATDEANIVLRYLLSTVEQQAFNVKRLARYHEAVAYRPAIQFHSAPTQAFVETRQMRDGMRLMLHQNVALANCRFNEGYNLFMEQGTGKTAVVIARIEDEARAMRESGETRMYRALVVAPKNVRLNWKNETARFATRPGKATVLRGGALDRVKLLLEALTTDSDDEFSIVVCSYETLYLSWDVLGKVEWDLSVLDESHYIKWPGTKRARAALKLRDKSRQRMCLTGTPICNSPMDLYTQLEFLQEGGSGFTSFDKFRHYYCPMVSNGRGGKRIVDVQNLPFMQERLARMAFIVRKEEALPDLPSKTYDTLEVEMSSAQREVYKAVQQQLIYEIQNEAGDSERTMNLNNILTRLLRLAQITSGFVSYDPIIDFESGEVLAPKVVETFDPNPKVEELTKLLVERKSTPDEKTIVWACWIHDIKAISDRLTAEGIQHVTYYGATSDKDRIEAEHRFNHDPDCQVFIGNPGCGGTGLNLIGYPPGDESYESDCTLVVYYSQDWSHPKRSQSEDRAHRRGTRRPVRILDMLMPGTIDEEIRARVTNKREVALDTQNLNGILGRILGREVML